MGIKAARSVCCGSVLGLLQSVPWQQRRCPPPPPPEKKKKNPWDLLYSLVLVRPSGLLSEKRPTLHQHHIPRRAFIALNESTPGAAAAADSRGQPFDCDFDAIEARE